MNVLNIFKKFQKAPIFWTFWKFSKSSKKHSICLCFFENIQNFQKAQVFENAIQNFQKVQKCSKNIENITNSSLFSLNRAFLRHLSPETRMDVKKPQILHGDDKLCMGLEPPPFFISYTIQMGLIRFEKVQKPFFSKCIRSKWDGEGLDRPKTYYLSKYIGSK